MLQVGATGIEEEESPEWGDNMKPLAQMSCTKKFYFL
jgi:hypothetical protein